MQNYIRNLKDCIIASLLSVWKVNKIIPIQRIYYIIKKNKTVRMGCFIFLNNCPMRYYNSQKFNSYNKKDKYNIYI